jgi:hypothetical protein
MSDDERKTFSSMRAWMSAWSKRKALASVSDDEGR